MPEPDYSRMGTAVTYVLIVMVLLFCGLVWHQAHAPGAPAPPLLSGHSATFEQIERWTKGEGPLPAPAEPETPAATEESVKRMMGAK